MKFLQKICKKWVHTVFRATKFDKKFTDCIACHLHLIITHHPAIVKQTETKNGNFKEREVHSIIMLTKKICDIEIRKLWAKEHPQTKALAQEKMQSTGVYAQNETPWSRNINQWNLIQNILQRAATFGWFPHSKSSQRRGLGEKRQEFLRKTRGRRTNDPRKEKEILFV
jgi:hypothetical protein